MAFVDADGHGWTKAVFVLFEVNLPAGTTVRLTPRGRFGSD